MNLSIEHLSFPVPMQDMAGEWHDGRANFAQAGLDVWMKTFHQAPVPQEKVTVVYADKEEPWVIEASHFSVVNLVRG